MTTTPPRGPSSTAARARQTRRPRFALLAVAATCLIGLAVTSAAGAAQAPVGLGTATSFAVLAGAGITNTGATTITGDVGSYPLGTQTGFGTVDITGTNHGDDAVTQQAKLDLVDAYNDAAGRGPDTTIVDPLAGQTLTPGVYSGGAILLNGTLTLDFEGDPDAVFVFQAASTLITGEASTVEVINDDGGTAACNIFWQVGSSATLGSGSTFVGSVLALTSITLDSTATVEGRLLARNGEVTLINNTITTPDCTADSPTPTTTTSPGDDDTDDGDTGGDGNGNSNGNGNGDSTTPDQSPTGPAGPGGPGSPGTPTDGSGTPVGSGPPTAAPPTELAFTGTDPRLAVIGIASLLAGLMCLTLSPIRRRIRT